MSDPPRGENPLREALEQQLAQSEWLQKFRRIGQVITTLKAEIPMVQLCDIQWLTAEDSLLIGCPNEELWNSLQNQAEQLLSLNLAAEKILLKYQDEQVILERHSGAVED